MLHKMRLGTRIVAGFAIVSFIGLFLSVTAVLSIRAVVAKNQEIAEVSLPSVEQLGVINEAQTAIDSAENALLYPKLDAKAAEEIFARMQSAEQRAAENIEKYAKLKMAENIEPVWSHDFLPAWKAWMKDHDDYVKIAKDYHGVSEEKRSQELYQRLSEQALVTNYKTFFPAEATLQKLITLNKQVAQTSLQEAQSTSSQATAWLAFLLILALSASGLLSWILSRAITLPINQISSALTQIANEIEAGATQLTLASRNLASSASEGAASLEETASSLEELSSMIQRNAQAAKQGNTLGHQTLTSADEGAAEAQHLAGAMEELTERNRKVKEISGVISDIAFQTNLLALNAAVEAARAGEHGAGFAVVAEAVRNLAQRSDHSAKEISRIIEETVASADQGSLISANCSEVLKRIHAQTKQVAALISEIATASSEQAEGMEQLGKAVAQIDRSTQINATTAENLAATTQEFSALIEKMKEVTVHLNNVISGESA